MTKIISLTYDLLEELKEEENFKLLKQLNQEIEFKYISLINDYQLAKNNYDNIMDEGGIYHPDFKEIAQKYSLIKTELFSKEEVRTILKLEKEIELKMNSIITKISNTISDKFNTPNEIGLLRGKK